MQYEEPSRDISTEVVSILKRFSQHANILPSQEPEAFGLATREKIISSIAKQEPISLVLPAFPWKNRNLDKVIGRHPDLGEELGLARLNHICEEIHKVYMHGARLHLISDGPVYNDLVGIPDDEYYEYGLELRALAVRKGFRHIKFLRLPELLQDFSSEFSKEAYLASVPMLRAKLEEFLDQGFDVDQEIRSNRDTNLTYAGYVKLAKEDLPWGTFPDKSSPPNADAVAKGMIRRLVAYENLISSKFSSSIRLSIHPSSGKTKISVPLLPQGGDESRGTPWHSSVVVLANGEVRTGLSRDFRQRYELFESCGRPWLFREKSDLFRWEADVDIEYEYEGLVVKSRSPEPTQLNESDQAKLADLILAFKKARVEGFTVSEEIATP